MKYGYESFTESAPTSLYKSTLSSSRKLLKTKTPTSNRDNPANKTAHRGRAEEGSNCDFGGTIGVPSFSGLWLFILQTDKGPSIMFWNSSSGRDVLCNMPASLQGRFRVGPRETSQARSGSCLNHHNSRQ